jgi:hypothetical protein
MSDTADEVLGPIDYLIVEYPCAQCEFDPEMTRELESLIAAELIRLLDVVVIDVEPDGRVAVEEVEELGDDSPLAAFRGRLAEILAAPDITGLAGTMEPGTRAAVLIVENRWAGPFVELTHRWGGRLVAAGWIPAVALLTAIERGDVVNGG